MLSCSMANICVFEDHNYTKLLPLVYLRPVCYLHCGLTRLLDKFIQQYPQAKIRIFCRDYLADLLKKEQGYAVNKTYSGSSKSGSEKVLFINARVLLSTSIPVEGDEEIGVKGDTVVYVRVELKKAGLITPPKALDPELVNKLTAKGFKKVETSCELIAYPWDLVGRNAEQIKKDFKALYPQPMINGRVYEGAHLVEEQYIFIGQSSKVYPGAVLNAEKGPIYIGKNVKILSNANIEGPVCIEDNTLIKMGAKIYGGTSIGQGCKIGGEIEESIVHAYTNKQHHGFVGHSYLGRWVNLGAGTTTSDLKNNYSSIKAYAEGKRIDTGQIFVGTIMADHAKAGINSMFAAGTVVGVGANAFGGGFLPKFVPSFAWCEEMGIVAYQLDKFIETALKAMARRKKRISRIEKDLIKHVFELTQTERDAVEMAG